MQSLRFRRHAQPLRSQYLAIGSFDRPFGQMYTTDVAVPPWNVLGTARYLAPVSFIERATSKFGKRLDIHGRQGFPPETPAGRSPELATEAPGPMSWKYVNNVDLQFRVEVRPPGGPSADEPDYDVVHGCDEVDPPRIQGTGFQRTRPSRDAGREIGRRPVAC